MLNYDSLITSFKELIEGNKYSPDKLLFIQPNDDSKSFAGEVKRFDEIANWYNKTEGGGEYQPLLLKVK